MRRSILAAVAALALAATGCGGDDGAGVRTIDGGGGSISGSGSGSGSGSASGVGSGSGSGSGAASGEASGGLGGYEPVSDVDPHAAVMLDVCDVSGALPGDGEMDFDAAATAYEEGGNSTSGDGSARTLQGFATGDHAGEPRWDAYVAHFESGWLDTFVSDALAGTGSFEGEADAVRRQGVQKGTANQVMIAWMLHELDAAEEAIEAGEIDPASGAPHYVDEGWAFYHGADPACGPYTTAAKRGDDYGTGSQVNDAMLAAFEQARDAAVDGDAEAFAQANEEIERQVLVTYLQATDKYAAEVTADLEADDEETARVHQAEGWAFWRVIAPFAAEADSEAAATISDTLDLASAPAEDSADVVGTAVADLREALEIDEATFGSYSVDG